MMEITFPPSFTLVAYLIIISIMIVSFAGHWLYSYVDRRWEKEITLPLRRLIEACQIQPEEDIEYFAVAIVRMEDEPIHTSERPRCDDSECPCNENERNREPECPPGYYWSGRQCLRENGWPTLSLAEREGL